MTKSRSARLFLVHKNFPKQCTLMSVCTGHLVSLWMKVQSDTKAVLFPEDLPAVLDNVIPRLRVPD